MIEFKNITYKEYINLHDKNEIDIIIKHGDVFKIATDHFNIGDFTKLNFGLVKDLQEDFTNELTWELIFDYLEKITGIKRQILFQKRILVLFQFINYICAEIKRISEIEKKLLFYAPTKEEVEAGIEEFNVFGSYLQKRQIAKELNLKLDEVNKMKYSDCLTELYAQNRLSIFNKRLSEIYNKPNGQI